MRNIFAFFFFSGEETKEKWNDVFFPVSLIFTFHIKKKNRKKHTHKIIPCELTPAVPNKIQRHKTGKHE